MMSGDRPILVTGGAGFIGANLADRLAAAGHKVLVYDALMRPGVDANLAWLRGKHPRKIIPLIADINDKVEISQAVGEAGAVFHLAAQVAVTTSLEAPEADFAGNLQGTVNLLEAVRRQGRELPFIFASTNKVYGNLSDLALRRVGDAYLPVDPEIRALGVSEQQPLSFHTPYGCSKGAADQYVLDYARSFGIPTAVLRMSCIYGPLQRGTEDQGWVAHFLIRALAREPISVFGDGFQVRDILYVDDAVDAYLAAWKQISAIRGSAFNLGGGPANAVSLQHVIREIEALLGHEVSIHAADWRAGDQRYYVSDTRRVRAALGLPAPKGWREGMRSLLDWLRQERTPMEAVS